MESSDLPIDNCPTLFPKYYLETPELSERHNRAIPPPEAYYYFPKGDSEIKHNEKKPSRSLRRIFKTEFGQYTPYELDQLSKLHDLMNTHEQKTKIEFIPEWTEADNLRYLYSTNCNIPQALKDMIEHFNWRRTTFPINPSSKCIEILNLGFIYVYGRDNEFRPIIICQAAVFVQHEKSYSKEEWLQASLYFCEYTEKNILLPGHVETWNMIVNARKVNALLLPSTMKKVIEVMSNNYRARLFANYIIGMSAALRILFKIICNFIDEVTVGKIKVIEDLNDPVMFTTITKENLEQKFGGNAKDIEPGKDILFPPTMPSLNFFKEDEKKEEKLMSEEEYATLYKENKLKVISPYFLKKLKEEEEAELQAKILKEKEVIVLEKSEEKKQKTLLFNEIDEQNDLICEKTSEDTSSVKSISKNSSYYPSNSTNDSNEIDSFNDKKRSLNSNSPKEINDTKEKTA